MLNFQKKSITIENETIQILLDTTLKLRRELKDTPNADYLIDALIPFAINQNQTIFERINDIISNDEIQSTFEKSPATTSNVNFRLKCVFNILNGVSEGTTNESCKSYKQRYIDSANKITNSF